MGLIAVGSLLILQMTAPDPLRARRLNLVEWLAAKPDLSEVYHKSLKVKPGEPSTSGIRPSCHRDGRSSPGARITGDIGTYLATYRSRRTGRMDAVRTPGRYATDRLRAAYRIKWPKG